MDEPGARGGRRERPVTRRFAAAIVAVPWLVLAAVAAGVTAAVVYLPGLAGTGGGLSGLVGRANPAI